MLNEILGAAARFNQLLTRKFNIAGGAPAPQLTPEIGCSYTIDEHPEDAILRFEGIATGLLDCAAIALVNSVAQIRNNTAGLIIVVEKIFAQVNAAAAADVNMAAGFIGTDHPGLPATGGITFADFRRAANGNVTVAPAARLTRNTVAAVPTLLNANLFYGRSSNAVGGGVVYDRPVVLAPGAAIQVSCGTVNTEILVMFSWREVPVAPGEVGPF